MGRRLVSGAALYQCEVRHQRRVPVRYGLRHRTYLWLVDLDELPALPWWLRRLAGFRAEDHLGPPGATLRAGVEEYLAAHGIDLRGGRIRMLAHARVLGHVFNPLTLYWCGYPGGAPACVVAEVHNTYGGRHRYLLHPDAHGRAEVTKTFPVSPFFPVDGSYRIRVPPPGERLAVGVTLRRNGTTEFVAGLTGRRRPGTAGALLRLAARYPLSTLAVSAGIRFHGVRLYLRGLPVHRPAAPALTVEEEL
ncbi:DUF1365 domain-containing protein [Dactylosporangium sucinum]|uniref:DUF1365 domain-containing protein n=1 Tax=Dactylosporangium sucinum TaxID=1424081 RepID=A0A917UJ15_9ACTN|nr:DUF1365 domain-containing protein [Dactylosporangium sucinum]GGM89546.1 DUF1365 domain-containing protein [Dactylosporangium sucinum]